MCKLSLSAQNYISDLAFGCGCRAVGNSDNAKAYRWTKEVLIKIWFIISRSS